MTPIEPNAMSHFAAIQEVLKLHGKEFVLRDFKPNELRIMIERLAKRSIPDVVNDVLNNRALASERR